MDEYKASATALNRMLQDNTHLDDCLIGVPPLAQQICYGVTRHFFYYSALLDELLDKPLPAKHSDLRMLLFCGLYSIDNLNRPAHASVNFAVESAAKLKKGWAKGLVNGVLRRYIREKEKLEAKVTNKNVEAQLNHPAWLINEIESAWHNADLFAANLKRPPMTLRVNLRKTTRAAYLELLQESGVTAQAGELAETAIILDCPCSINELPGFDDGLVSVQDEGAQLAASLLDVSEGQMVLDACAAPGGKTGHLLELADINLTAIDWDKKRINRISENLERLQLTAEVLCQDLEDWTTTLTFDRILLDAPCSATGIIRRHPDIKLLRTKSDIDKLVHIQSVLLNKAFDLLGTGSELLYSTCSILPKENDEVIAKFLAEHADAELLPIQFNGLTDQAQLTDYGLQLFPTATSHDGFYYSRLRRSAR